MNEGDELSRLIAQELRRPVSSEVEALARTVRERHGEVVRAILFYGSCLRRDGDLEGVADFYVLIDRYRRFYANPLLAASNALLPPNVFYVEMRAGGRTLRAKYAVLSIGDFLAATSLRCREPYFWARFAQPCVLVHADDGALEQQVIEGVASAVTTFVRRGLALVSRRFAVRDLWVALLTESYRAEMRAERGGAPERLYDADARRHEQVTEAALRRLPESRTTERQGGQLWAEVELRPIERRTAAILWRILRMRGKLRSLLRIVKSAATFEGGVDYVIWKVERHSGEKVDPTWREKRHRLLALGGEVWRLYRKGAFR
jgi:hypothetical protein